MPRGSDAPTERAKAYAIVHVCAARIPARQSLPRSSDRRCPDLKRFHGQADTGDVDAAERKQILDRYRDHSRRFEAAAARRSSRRHGSVIPFTPPTTRELGIEKMR